MILRHLIDQHNKQKGFDFDNFTSPIFDEIKDSEELKLSYNKYPIIPFFGSNEQSSDSILNTLHRLSEVTPIVAGIIESFKNFCIGANFDLKNKKGLGVLNKNYEDASDEIKNNFELQFLDTFVNTDLQQLAEYGSKSLAIDGNCGYLVSVEKTSSKAKIEHIQTTKFRLLDNSIYTDDYVMISNSFLHSYLVSVEPQIVPCYPNYIEIDGVCQTFIHAKKASANRRFYGYSNGASSIMQQYLLNQLTVYLSAETDNRFTRKVMFDIPFSGSDLEGDNAEDIKDFEENQKNTFTNKGSQKSSILNFFRTALDGTDTKIYVHQFAANTEHDFYDKTTEILESQILKAFGWSRSLLGDNSDSGMFGERLESVYMGASQQVKPTQKIIENSLNDCFKFVEDQTGKDLMRGSILVLNSVYDKMINEKKETENIE